MRQIARNLTDPLDGALIPGTYVLMDRDAHFSSEFRRKRSKSLKKPASFPCSLHIRKLKVQYLYLVNLLLSTEARLNVLDDINLMPSVSFHGRRMTSAVFDLLTNRGTESRDYVELSRDNEYEPPNFGGPTQARPGSLEKLTVMTERYCQGQQLHHPDDVSWLGLLIPGKMRLPPSDFT